MIIDYRYIIANAGRGEVVGMGYCGDVSPRMLSESGVRITSVLTSTFEKIHTAIYLHKGMLTD